MNAGTAAMAGDVASAERPVVFFSNGIGDAVLALPALRALHGLFGARMRLVCPAVAARHCFGDFSSQLDEIVVLEYPAAGNGPRTNPSAFDVADVASALGSCDAFITVVTWHSDSLEELILRLVPHTTVGYSQQFDLEVPLNRGVHSADIAFRVPQALGVAADLESMPASLRLPASATDRAARIRLLLPPGAKMVTLHADTDPGRRWTPDGWHRVVDDLTAARPDTYVFVVGLPGAVDEASMRDERVISCLGAELTLTFALVAGSDAFIGVNSSMLHVADVSHVPGVGLFDNPLAETEWGFRYAEHRHVTGGAAMSEIAAEDVTAAILEILDGLTR